MMTWRGTGWTESGKKGPLVHSMLHFSVDVSQWLFWCIGLFIPLHSPIWGYWIVWKCRGVSDTHKIISKPYKC
jgi:hypothetical protein